MTIAGSAAGITGPIGDDLAFRLDGVLVKRDGFYDDINNDTDVNDRNRWFTRGQLLYEPNDHLSVRLIGDYTWRKEKCCGAVYVNNDINDNIGDLNNPSIPAAQQQQHHQCAPRPWAGSRRRSTMAGAATSGSRPGRSYKGKTTDGGVSLQVDYDFGSAKLTSITAYRGYKSEQNGDFDFGTVDILYRDDDGDSFRKFKTFSQELRLQGSAFNDKLDWLVGGYFANEDLTLTDNLRFGEDYGRFATCRIITGGGLGGPLLANQPGLRLSGVGPAAISGASGASGPTSLPAFDRLDTLNDLGSTQDIYKQNSRNWALFTHNIFHVTDKLDVTVGLRYTNERKKFDATFGNDNTVCPPNQGGARRPVPRVRHAGATARALAGALIGAELPGQFDRRAERRRRSTTSARRISSPAPASLSYKPIDDLLLYASYSRGYKAGGFNLDRSALKSPILPFALVWRRAGAGRRTCSSIRKPSMLSNWAANSRRAASPSTSRCSARSSRTSSSIRSTARCSSSRTSTAARPIWRTDEDQSTSSISPAAQFQSRSADRRLRQGRCHLWRPFAGRRAGSIGAADARPAPQRRPDLGRTPNIAVTWSARTRARRSTRRFAGCPDGSCPTRPRPWRPARWPGPRRSAAAACPACSTSMPATPAATTPAPTCSRRRRQDAYTLVNARVGIRGPDDRWSVELWAQNLFDKDYQQVAFNSPFQAGATSAPVRRSGLPGRPPDLLDLPGRAAHLRPDPPGEFLGAQARAGRGGTAASSAASASGDADLRGRVGDPGDGRLPAAASAPAASAASAGAGARLRPRI